MIKLFYFLLFTFCLLFSVSCSSKTEAEVKPKETVPPTELIKQAEALFVQRIDVVKLREAVNTMAKARNPDQRNFEVEWKFAKYNYFLSKQVTDEKEADKLLKDGYSAGLIASRLEPNKPDGYFWAGACLGEQSQRSPLTVGIKSIGELRELMGKVIEIQPDYQNASAFDGLAQIEMETPLTGGSPEKAVEYLEKALTYEKENGYIYLHLAEAYLAVKKPAEAKKQLEFIFKIKRDPEFEVERIEVESEAKKLLNSRF
ncbi:MAG TPA: tetratricopeptide repeat protein [Pyrinomonadaceae bacterium]|nr:tetratricopeptide repeat protein [Pyrinomonadaceae bacterium]